MTSERAGGFDLQGPDEMSFDGLVRLLNGASRIGIAHVPFGRTRSDVRWPETPGSAH